MLKDVAFQVLRSIEAPLTFNKWTGLCGERGFLLYMNKDEEWSSHPEYI